MTEKIDDAAWVEVKARCTTGLETLLALEAGRARNMEQELAQALVVARNELIRLRRVLLPMHAGKIAEPDAKIVSHASATRYRAGIFP